MRYSLLIQASAALLSVKGSAAEEIAADTKDLLHEYPSFLRPALKDEVLLPAGLLVKRQQPGAVCDTEDPVLTIMEQHAEATPFCSSFIGIPAVTSTGTYQATVTARVTSTRYLNPSGTVVVTETYTPSATARLAKRADTSEQDAALASAVSSACSCIYIPEATVAATVTGPTVTRTKKIIQYGNAPYTTTVYVTLNATGSSSTLSFPENSRTVCAGSTCSPTTATDSTSVPINTPPSYNATVDPTNSSRLSTLTITDASKTFCAVGSTCSTVSTEPTSITYEVSSTSTATLTKTVTAIPTSLSSSTGFTVITPSDNSRTASPTGGEGTSTSTSRADVTVTVTVTNTGTTTSTSTQTWTNGPWNSTSIPTYSPTGTGSSSPTSVESRTGSQMSPTSTPLYPTGNSSTSSFPMGTGSTSISFTDISRTGSQTPPTSTPLYPNGNTTTPSYPTGTGASSSSSSTKTVGPWNSTLTSSIGPTGTGISTISTSEGSRTGSQVSPTSTPPYATGNTTTYFPTGTGSLTTSVTILPSNSTLTPTVKPTGTDISSISASEGSRTGSQTPPTSKPGHSTSKTISLHSTTPKPVKSLSTSSSESSTKSRTKSRSTTRSTSTGSISIPENSRTGSQTPPSSCPTLSTLEPITVTVTATATVYTSSPGASPMSTLSPTFNTESRVIPTRTTSTDGWGPTPPSYGDSDNGIGNKQQGQRGHNRGSGHNWGGRRPQRGVRGKWRRRQANMNDGAADQ